MMKYLFIGGSKDGERLVVNRCEFLVLEAISIDNSMLKVVESGEPVTIEPMYRKDSYRKETYLCEGKSFDVFILEGIGNSTAFNMLLNGYKQLKT